MNSIAFVVVDNTVRSFDEGTIGPKQWKGQWKSPHRKRTGR